MTLKPSKIIRGGIFRVYGVTVIYPPHPLPETGEMLVNFALLKKITITQKNRNGNKPVLRVLIFDSSPGRALASHRQPYYKRPVTNQTPPSDLPFCSLPSLRSNRHNLGNFAEEQQTLWRTKRVYY